MNQLERIISATREEVARRRRAVPLAELERTVAPAAIDPARSFSGALSRPGISLIAEHKRRSPSAGRIRDGLGLEDVVGAYERGGAAAVSILTDGPSFGGSLADLRAARTTAALPILRKDFVVDAYQLHESRAAGADAILLIVAALTAAELPELLGQAGALGLDVLVEIHDERELDCALAAGAALIGINNRDLKDLSVDTRRTFELRPRVPNGVIVVAESGFRTREELEALDRADVDAVLVGEALMRATDIESACRALSGTAP